MGRVVKWATCCIDLPLQFYGWEGAQTVNEEAE